MNLTTNIEDLLATALYELLIADSELTDLLGTYAGAPCVFGSELVPEDAPRPYVFVSAPVRNRPHDTKTSAGRMMSVDIHCVTKNTRTVRFVNAIAAHVRRILNENTLELPDSETRAVAATVDGPIPVPCDESVTARGLSAHFKIM